jgi:CubicO group peptidase (beta-lactamase class C family)
MRQQAIRQWGWLVMLSGLMACGQSPQRQLTASANRLTDCTQDQALSPTEEAAIRQAIHADDKTRRIDAIIRQKVQQQGFNGNVLIAQRGVVLYKGSFGLAHFEKSDRDSLTDQSRFQLASLSKTFTAIATLKLVEAGRISLDDSVQRFFPDFPYHRILIRDLLSHRSGLPNYGYMFDDSARANLRRTVKRYPTNITVLHWMATMPHPPRPYGAPGLHFSYSNTNYMILAAIIEQVARQPFNQFVRKNILEPVGMYHTYVAGSGADSINHYRTAGYQWNRRVPKDFYDDVVGDKGVYSTVGDLFRWYRALNGECLLKASTLAQAFEPRSFERKGARNYGYGFRMQLDSTNRPAFIYHTGWWKGYNTMFWFSPKDEYVIILLSNRYNRGVYAIGDLIQVLHGTPQPVAVETGAVDS